MTNPEFGMRIGGTLRVAGSDLRVNRLRTEELLGNVEFRGHNTYFFGSIRFFPNSLFSRNFISSFPTPRLKAEESPAIGCRFHP